MAASRSTTLLAGLLVIIYVLLSAAFYWFVDRPILEVLNLSFNIVLQFIATCVLLEVFCALIEIARASARRKRVLASGAVKEALEVKAVIVDGAKVQGGEDMSQAMFSPGNVKGRSSTLVNVPFMMPVESVESGEGSPVRDSCHSTYSVYGYGVPRAMAMNDPEMSDASSMSTVINPGSSSPYLTPQIHPVGSSKDAENVEPLKLDDTTPSPPTPPPAPILLKGNETFSSTSQYPTIDIILVAYLPNEKDIIVSQLRTFATAMSYPRDKLRILCAYNTPKDIPDVEEQLRMVEAEFAGTVVVEKVMNSRSKAQNVNRALKLVQADIVALFDTDHKLDPMALHYVVHRFAKGDVDLLQGRCAISNPTHSFPTYFISAEFDIIYGLFHPGRAALHGFGLFGGTNGFWKRSLLKHVGMDPTMLTEDIDSAFRSLEAGARIVYDMNVVSYELAPETFTAFWNQRVRWAQGWVQVTLRHFLKSVKTGARKAPVRSRLGLIMLLLFREVSFYILSQFLVQLILAIARLWVEDGTPFWVNWRVLNIYAASFVGYDAFIMLCIGLVACWNRSRYVGVFQFIIYVILSPFYLTFQTFLGIYAHGRELAMVDKWVVTSRAPAHAQKEPIATPPTPPSTTAEPQLPLPEPAQLAQPEMATVERR
ncbi:hypothetical protein HDV00_005026 [Rhizophlyctis rosea]|nr:hypothetical protein HDV00_005026 [Rhizophlyctis rosea]